MAQGILYRIVDWTANYENNRTKELKAMRWVPIPAQLDGDGYTELLDHKNGAAHYGAWVACVIVAGRCDPRGTLLRGTNRPFCAASLARVTRIPQHILEEALPRFVRIGWMSSEVVDTQYTYENVAGASQEGAGKSHFPALNGRKEGIEGNNKTRNRTAPAGVPARFDDFWIVYPRKVAKPKAMKAWERATKSADADAIVAAAVQFAGSDVGQSGEFCPHPATWLNECRWADDPATWRRSNPTRHREPAALDFSKVAEALGEGAAR